MENTRPQRLPSQISHQSQPLSGNIKDQSGTVPIMIGGVLLLLVVAGGGYYLGTQKNSFSTNTRQTNLTPTGTDSTRSMSPTSLTTVPSDDVTADWKVYANLTHRFSFRYPRDVFVYQGEPEQDTQYWSNKVNGGAPFELGQDGLWLNVSFTPRDRSMMDFYNRIIELEPNETIVGSAITRLSDIDSKGVRGATYHQGRPTYHVGDPADTYEAIWVKGNMVYRLSLSAFTE